MIEILPKHKWHFEENGNISLVVKPQVNALKIRYCLKSQPFFNFNNYPNPKIEITNLALSLTLSAFTKNSRRTNGWD